MDSQPAVTEIDGVRLETLIDHHPSRRFVLRMEIDTECNIAVALPAAVSMLRDAATAMETQTNEYLAFLR
ncbi:hypothetical protein [Corynebacterium mastitidis]|uniref:hypothetical protein n=1 Tax=Corynebacterium mastitidis TaxID=161890 RepID=UPI0003657D27|nr:hypothetical protein [Corynebacterium mastitidis]